MRAKPRFTPTDLTPEAVLLRVEEWKRLTGARGPSPEPLLPAPTRAAHSPVQKGAHLTAAHFVNESSPVMDRVPLQLAEAERPAGSRDSALRSGHPRRVVAHNASNFLRSAAPHAFLSSDVLPLQKTFPSPLSLLIRSRVRLQTRSVKPCPLVLCSAEASAPSRPGTLRSRTSCEAKRVKRLVPSARAREGTLETHAGRYIHATPVSVETESVTAPRLHNVPRP